MTTKDSLYTSLRVTSGIRSEIETIEENAHLREPINFTIRADAIDFIDFHIIDRMEGVNQHDETMGALRQRAEKLKSELELIDVELFKQIREKVRAAFYSTSSFNRMIRVYLGSYFDETVQAGYDHLDTFINGILSYQDIPEPTGEPESDMVFYQKTPARIILEMTKLAELSGDDVFYDIGSGLGQAAILVNLLSGCRTRGIEYDPAFCRFATTTAADLNLFQVEFINTNALHVNFTEGTVFFMYTPFEGLMLQGMLEILQNESQKRPVKVFTYGPCSSFVARQHWLRCEQGSPDNPDILCMFKSIN